MYSYVLGGALKMYVLLRCTRKWCEVYSLGVSSGIPLSGLLLSVLLGASLGVRVVVLLGVPVGVLSDGQTRLLRSF